MECALWAALAAEYGRSSYIRIRRECLFAIPTGPAPAPTHGEWRGRGRERRRSESADSAPEEPTAHAEAVAAAYRETADETPRTVGVLSRELQSLIKVAAAAMPHRAIAAFCCPSRLASTPSHNICVRMRVHISTLAHSAAALQCAAQRLWLSGAPTRLAWADAVATADAVVGEMGGCHAASSLSCCLAGLHISHLSFVCTPTTANLCQLPPTAALARALAHTLLAPMH